MQIIRNYKTRMTLNKFADEHGLTLVITERDQSAVAAGLSRFFVDFYGIEVKEGSCLVGAHGNGNTELEAVQDYVEQISGKELVYGAYTAKRKEITAPIIEGFTL